MTASEGRWPGNPILTWEGEGEVPSFCPEGCGGLTEDPYGGPCKACWNRVGKTNEPDDLDGDEEDEDEYPWA